MSLKETFLMSPLSVPGCLLWLDAADTSKMSLSGSNIVSITDKSPSSLVFSASPTRPVRSSTLYNGFSPIQFSGTSFLLNSTFSYTLNSRSAFIVAGETTLGNNNGFLSFATSGTDYNSTSAMAYESGNKPVNQMFQSVAAFGAGGYAISVAGSTATPFAVYGETFGSGTAVLYSNGTQAATASTGQVFTNSTGLYLGARMGGGAVGNYLTGVIAEVILFNRALTISERQKIEGYLAWKWGLQGNLPSTHPFKTYRPVNGLSISIPLSYNNPKKTVNLEPFDPRSISGCQLWLDAADTTSFILSGFSVTQWNDKSGKGYNATTPIGTVTRTATINSRAVITFGDQSYLTISSFVQNFSYCSVFFVMRSTTAIVSGNFNFVLWVNTTGVLNTGLVNSSGTYLLRVGKSGTLLIDANLGSNPQNQVLLVAGVITGNTATQYINNNGSPLTPTINVAGSLDSATSSINVGGMPFAVSTGYDLGEVLVYNTSLTDAQRQQIEGYLAWKWGLTSSLPANHPFKTPLAPFPLLTVPRKGGLRSFTPTSISGLQLWLDATDVNGNGTPVANGATVSTWTDKSGNGRNATGGTSPTYSNNGVVFNGSAFLTTTYSAVPAAETLYVVSTFSGAADGLNYAIIGSSANQGRNLVSYRTNVNLIDVHWDKWGVSGYAYSAGVVFNQKMILGGIYTGSSGATNINGGADSSSSFSFSGSSTTQIGRSPGSLYTGTIHEVVIFSSVLNRTQRQTIEGYLAWKWGLQSNLPSTQPFKLFPPPP